VPWLGRGPRVIGRSSGPRFDVSRVGLCETEPSRGGGDLTARPHIELAQDRGDVVIDGLPAHDQPFGDLGVAKPLGEQRQNLQLTTGQPGRVRPGPGARSTRDPPFAQLAQPASGDGLRSPGAQLPKLVEGFAKCTGLTRVRERQRRFVSAPAVLVGARR
jgi:hypothetical protein